MIFSTEQEEFWAQNFGDEYVKRNGYSKMPSRMARFLRVLELTRGVNSFLELGANVGSNIVALKPLKPSAKFAAVEINKTAFELLSKIEGIEAVNESILNFKTDEKFDFVFTSGVLIHINPERLADVYNLMYTISTKYIWICEYYNPVPVEVEYRGEHGKLFKRDFAGEMLDMYPSLELVGYGFDYHRDNNFPVGDSTWFLLKK
ncbi:MAG: hypothetical protein LBB04_00840 [Oscillospiraceae bacterium]|jgi:spore coat polysaccharide biosynthesis protein SpsF|nr:hypothetical protein [Oscillospiraceae bacterium]